MAHNAPGKNYREGMSVVQLMDMFPNEDSAHKWFVDRVGERRASIARVADQKPPSPASAYTRSGARTAMSVSAFAPAQCLRSPAFLCASGQSRSTCT